MRESVVRRWSGRATGSVLIGFGLRLAAEAGWPQARRHPHRGGRRFDPNTSPNSGAFPVHPRTCKPITPWDYLGDNTIFQVIRKAGLRTAWSDKHEVYASFNGPGSDGQSIDDLFSPEIDSQAVMPHGVPYPQDDDWAHIDAATKQTTATRSRPS